MLRQKKNQRQGGFSYQLVSTEYLTVGLESDDLLQLDHGGRNGLEQTSMTQPLGQTGRGGAEFGAQERVRQACAAYQYTDLGKSYILEKQINS